MSNLRERIRASQPQVETLDVEGWNETVELRPMTVGQKYGLFGDSADDLKPEQLATMLPQVIVLTAHDPETGDPVFTDADLDWLAEQPAGPVETVAMAGLAISGLDEKAVDAAKKDSSSTTSTAPATSSPTS